MCALSTKTRTSTNIAARRGFSHAAAFSRAFRNVYDMPPTAFRKQFLAPTEDRCPAQGEGASAARS
ncbi:helix-turn-helix domain-containing protein [Streptomyces sp. NPDC052000]|uniref:helix-turn-helix domain-containing protein n=1 Tax=Streptomyces sp. NPDC052000 TaxID=3155676 RepID=UPI00344C2F0C